MLAVGLSRFTQIEEDARSGVRSLTRSERRADQSGQPGVLLGSARAGLFELFVTAARGHSEYATNRLHVVLVLMGLHELVSRTDSSGTQLRGHQYRLPKLPRILALFTKPWELQERTECLTPSITQAGCAFVGSGPGPC